MTERISHVAKNRLLQKNPHPKDLFLQILPQMLHLLKLLTPFLTFQEKAYIN